MRKHGSAWNIVCVGLQMIGVLVNHSGDSDHRSLTEQLTCIKGARPLPPLNVHIYDIKDCMSLLLYGFWVDRLTYY